MCNCVCVHDNSKNDGAINLKLEYVVTYGNSFDEFDIGHCPIKVKVTLNILDMWHETFHATEKKSPRKIKQQLF